MTEPHGVGLTEAALVRAGDEVHWWQRWLEVVDTKMPRTGKGEKPSVCLIVETDEGDTEIRFDAARVLRVRRADVAPTQTFRHGCA